ncbi:hypothetical protein [Nitratidesulfovibrio liaohensis]|uniref:Uncharacterized protein n=1 Tax=Nitratidesulfovibrio liaohensis TaxID=2604158 RepID=A0ABY9R3J6_9BACT|nr:hypothetical protein [Nitratidesulfovibrio liaohensis]WMW65145.1 hypothetical protein KPS_003250 [Nitratidesulfovibrio liaohensis]
MGNYLHAPLSSTEQHVTKERLLRFKDQIKEALDYLISILEKNRAHPTLNDKGAHFFKLYCSGIFSQEAIRQNMSLALTP